ncbi:13189_t:CDS:2 [Entrophospora sp. SA101]|nr:13189_t:CDS:2 [Entrophospora sp. SA101]
MKKLDSKIKIEHPDYSDDEFSDSDLPPLVPVFAENWFYGRKYNDGELQTYIPEIVTDTEDAWVRTTLRIKDLKTKKGGRVIVSVNKIINDVHNFTSDSDTSSDNDSGNSSTSS